MPVEYSVNIAYDDVYDDYATVDVNALVTGIPSKMALALVCHYTAQIHTQEKNPAFQIRAVSDWTRRFPQQTRQKIQTVIDRFNAKGRSNFNFINNVSSLYLIECLLQNHNELPVTKDLSPEQEENLFKAYLFFSAKWTKAQEAGMIKYRGDSPGSMAIVGMLPFSELLEFKDFRLQFLKAVYFFKFCQDNKIFSEFLQVFLKKRGLDTWNQYLFNLISVYVFLLGKDSVKSVLTFDKQSEPVFSALQNFCISVAGFTPVEDFLTIRTHPIYRYADNELLFLNINFLIDKIYQGIMFDFADVLISEKVTYKGKVITNRTTFFGIFGDEFIEPGLFYQVMKHCFRQKDYIHFTGADLKEKIGDGFPDYLIVDGRKLYVFEFKNTFFSGPVKYKFDIEEIKTELDKKFVRNIAGKPKGVTQLVHFIENLLQENLSQILPHDPASYIVYPVLVTTDFTFNLPYICKLISDRFCEISMASTKMNRKIQTNPITMVDFDSLLKFQDLFITKKLTLNHVLKDYQNYLGKGTNEIDRTLSFNKYLHDKTAKWNYDSPKMFMQEIKQTLFP